MQKPIRSDQQPDDARENRTPASDMQPEDAGTADSGNDEPGKGRANESEAAMKQTSKTDAERGGNR